MVVWNDMREFMNFLESKSDLLRITDEVDPDWEVNGITRKILQKNGPAVLFENIRGSDYPLLTGILATRKRFLWALGIEKIEDFNIEWARRTENLIPVNKVSEAPCQENIIKGDDIDLFRISNVKWHQYDNGPFIGTMTISITKDPETGVLNAGIYRMEILNKNTTGWGAPEYSHGRLHYKKYEELGEDMPMACITGCDPSILIASTTRTPPDINEFELAGALRGEPVKMVKCKSIDLEVPATSEFVFEGYVPVGERQEEGPFGEYTGYYGEQRTNPVFKVQTVTHRNNPIYLGTREQWAPSESAVIVGMTSQAEAFRTLRTLVPGILDMRCDVAYEAIVKIKKMYRGHAQQVMDAIWGGTYAKYKHVIVVDQDIDIWNYEEVHWALSTRVDAKRDVYISKRRSGQWLDPSVPLRERGWQSVMGIDATMPVEDFEFYGEKYPRKVDDPEIVKKVEEKWGDRL